MRLAMLAAMVFALTAAPAFAAEPRGEGKYLETVGVGTIKVKPDTARVSFGVLTGMVTIKEVRDENAKLVKKVGEALAALKIAGMEVKVIAGDLILVHASPVRMVGGGVELQPSVIGYKVLTTFVVTVAEKESDKLRALANRILDAAVENGANTGGTLTSGTRATPTTPVIEYVVKDLSEAKRQAMVKASQNAMADIKALATGAGINNYETILVSMAPFAPKGTEGDRGADSRSPFDALIGGAFGGGAIAGPGAPSPDDEIEVTIKVLVRCKF